MGIALIAAVLLVQAEPGKKTPEPAVGGGARVIAWLPTVGGEVSVDEHDSRVTLEDDLDLERPGWTGVYELTLFPGEQSVSLYHWGFSASGAHTLEDPETLDDSRFSAGDRVRGRLRFGQYGINLDFPMPPTADLPFRGWLGTGLHHFRAEVEMRGATGSASEQFADLLLRLGGGADWLPLPGVVAGVRASLYTDFLTLLPTAFGGSLPHGAGDVDLYAGVRWGPVRAEAGYRLFGWSVNLTEEELDVLARGPWASLTLRF